MRLPILDSLLLGCIVATVEIHSRIRTLRLKGAPG
jgi:hypothetical protein